MEDFHFLRPWWLLNIAALVIIAPLLWRQLGKHNGWHKVIAGHLATPLLGTPGTARRGVPFAIFTAAWIILSLALSGPAWERLPVPAYSSERAAVIVMDMSMNTRAADVTPDRLSRLRFKALDLLDELPATQVGVVAYAGDAFSISPLTHDHQNIRSMLPALAPEIMPVAGNYPLLAIQEAHRMLSDAGYERGEIFWFGAGIRQNDYQDIRSFLRGKNHRLSTLIAGNDESTPIRLADGDMLRDNLGRLSMVQLNSNLFERLSNEFNGRNVRLRADDTDIQYIAGQTPLNRGATETDGEGVDMAYDQWRDRGPYLAWLLIPLALLAARKGVILCLLALPFTGMLQPVHAATSNTSSPVFKNQQQRAMDAYQAGQYLDAAELFKDPMMRGNAYYRASDYAAALDAYAQATDTPERWFNSANSLAQLGELEAAIDAYEEALQHRPDWLEALENKALVEELKDQQDAQQEQQNESGEGESQADDDPQQQDGDQGEDQQQSQNDQPEQQDQEQQEQPDDTNDESSTGAPEQAEDEAPVESEQTEADGESPEQQAIEAALSEDDLSDEERAELEQLLRRVQSDPAVLLRNRMRLEAERRQYGLPPRGARQP